MNATFKMVLVNAVGAVVSGAVGAVVGSTEYKMV